MRRGKAVFEAIMRNGSMVFLLGIFMLMSVGLVFILQGMEYNDQVEYEANHPRLPIQNGSKDKFIFSGVPIEPMARFVLKTQDNDKNIMFVIESADDFDYTNSTISINTSYIKEVRQENNTMIISIRKD